MNNRARQVNRVKAYVEECEYNRRIKLARANIQLMLRTRKRMHENMLLMNSIWEEVYECYRKWKDKIP